MHSCASYETATNKKDKKKYFSSIGFSLIYEDEYYSNKLVNKKINNNKIRVLHNTLRSSTPIRIINPDNLKFIDTKITRTANYPKIFNSVISKEISRILDLDIENPYVEIIEIKKNKTFIARKANTFEEEKNVAEKAPVDQIKIDDLSNISSQENKKHVKKNKYILLINEFYYEKSAVGLKNELIKKTKINNFYIKKINNTKYRLLVGPFKNFNALKTTYISLNNLGFEDLNINKN